MRCLSVVGWVWALLWSKVSLVRMNVFTVVRTHFDKDFLLVVGMGAHFIDPYVERGSLTLV